MCTLVWRLNYAGLQIGSTIAWKYDTLLAFSYEQVVGGPRGAQPWRWGNTHDRNAALQHGPPLAGASAPSGQVHYSYPNHGLSAPTTAPLLTVA